MTDNSKDKAKFVGKHDPKKYIDTEPNLETTAVISEEMLMERAALNMAQRRKRAMTMRRYKNKLATSKARMAKRRAPEEKLQVRARKKALSALKARLIGGRQYGDLSTAEKIAVDKRAERIPATLVARIAQKLLPKVRQAETERLKSLYAHMGAKNEDYDLNEEFESFLEEKRYHNLLNKDNTVKADKRFKIYRPKKNTHFTEELQDLEESVESFLEESFRIKNLIPDGPKPVRVSTDHSKVKLPQNGTIKTLNDIFAKEGWSIALHKGPGYFYFEDIDPNGIADTRSVMTMRFSDLPFKTWYEDGKAFYKSLSEMNIDPRDREEGTDELVKMLKGDTPGQHITELAMPSKEDTMGFHRRGMPQIKGEDTPHFLKYLKAQGINATEKEVNPTDLKASQAHFNQDKINAIMDKLKNGETSHNVLASNDGCVIDGHHRWLAHVNLDLPKMKITQVDLPHDETIKAMKDYPRSFTKNLSEGVTADDYITPTQMKAFEKVVDQLFAKFKIDFKFTSHFGDRMVDTRNNPLVTLKDLAATIKKLYDKIKKDGKTLSKHLDAEAVIKDAQNDLNIPIAVEYDRKNDELDVVLKTVMRKKKFLTPDPEIKV